MTTSTIIHAFSLLQDCFSSPDKEMSAVITKAEERNHWFSYDQICFALQSISEAFLDKEKLAAWIKSYTIKRKKEKKIGVVMAGNIPLAGFHDFMCVLLSNNKVMVKCSSQDNILLPHIAKRLCSIHVDFDSRIEFVDILRGFDGIIATGSNNSARYFNYYFGKYPHIIRKNRVSAAILNGNESIQDIALLGEDIFQYFGLGCRNISKLYVPENYEFDTFFKAIEPFSGVLDSHKYKNNYDYTRTLLLMNNTNHFSNDFLLINENTSLFSPLASLHYEVYTNKEQLKSHLNNESENIQCVAISKGHIDDYRNMDVPVVPFGKTQRPALSDYADGIDTMEFLLSL